MAERLLHSPAFLRKLLSYNPLTGEMVWLPRGIEMFQKPGKAAEVQAANWNAKYAGKQVFTRDASGYRTGCIFGVRYRGHHIAWAVTYGRWPINWIDHINGVRDDNRIANLREVCPEDNALNVGRRPDNKSGITGVYQNKMGKWVAQITFRNKNYYLGEHKSILAATMARKKAEIEFGFHPQHGVRPSHGLIMEMTRIAISASQELPQQRGQHHCPVEPHRQSPVAR